MKIARSFAAAVSLCMFGFAPLQVTAATVVHEGRGHPWIGLLDGRELPTNFAGGAAGFIALAKSGTGVAAALAGGDLDGDHLTDLVALHGDGRRGWLTLHRANLDARDPNGPRARMRKAGGTFDDVPLLRAVRVAALPIAADLLATGDLDGDGRDDVVVARRGHAELWWLAADGDGTLKAPRPIRLRGGITALATGDADRADGRHDIVAGTLFAGRAELSLVRRQEDGAFSATVLLAGEKRFDALALGSLDRGKTTDLAAAAGRTLTVLFGDRSGRYEDGTIHRETFAERIRAISIGEFDDATRHGPGVAVLLDNGDMHLVRFGEREDAERVRVASLGEAPCGSSCAAEMVSLNLSNRPGDDLLLRDPADRRLFVRVGGLAQEEWAALDAGAEPLAVCPLRLNGDAFADVVTWTGGSSAPTVRITAASHIHAVDSTADGGDADTGDGVCATAAGTCTLRAAVEQANAAAGTDAIRFDIPGPGLHTIQPLSPLPAITDTLLLDATTEPDYSGVPVVELDGSLAGETDGLQLLAGSSSVIGLAVNRFGLAGVVAIGTDAVDNRIQACRIGTDPAGTTGLGNSGSGVYLDGGARGTVIGSDGDGVADSTEGNVISGNAGNGVAVAGDETEGNVVAGNFVGTNASGTAAIGNGGFGVAVFAGAHDNLIGTNGDGLADTDERNVLSGNQVRGVLLAMGAESNVVAGNRIGTDLTGSAALPNAGGGIEIANGARYNLVGTDADGLADDVERNVVSGNNAAGIVMFGEPLVEGNAIAGNYIGTDASGGADLGNEHDGISMSDVSGTRIGGPLAAQRNVISGNGGNGVSVGGAAATGTVVQGNHIGTDASGTLAIGNDADGVVIGESADHVVGTDGDGVDDGAEGNLISGNNGNGVNVFGAGAENNVIAGNVVGVAADGVTALGNGQFGVAIVGLSKFNRIGTDGDGVSDVEERNVLSGNLVRGVLIAADAEQNVVAGNFVGTDAGGGVAVPNAAGGVELSNGARFNRIGTNADGQNDEAERNVISGNSAYGVTLFGSPPAEDNVIAGNYIGVAADGVTDLGNTTHGIVTTADANRNTIGGLGVTPGSCDGPCNVIAHNGTGASLDGVRIAAGTENAILGNVIFDSYGGTGIDIAGASPTPNDQFDTDGESNNGQNFPMLTAAITTGGTTTIDGALHSLPVTDFHLEFFANPTCHRSGYGEGEVLVGTHEVTTGTGGNASISVPVSPAVPDGWVVTATATRMAPGNVPTDTSEFSPCLALGPAVAAGSVPDGHLVPGTRMEVVKGAGNNLIFTWSPSCVPTDVDYAVYQGNLGDPSSHVPRICSTGGLTTRTLWISATDVYFFVVPLSGNREGWRGADGDGVERPAGLAVCHEQLLGDCP